ncbi:hypothetical protein CC2G_009225 [Coprinopsis cinerea AmutBmut pab1-1]|nr:hypothetical protein CC2G_009225 [Coprinopsis cinerea AmutBmut pab1-1]
MAHSSPSRKKRPTDGQSTQPSKKQKKSAGGDAKKGKGKDSDFQVVSATLSISVPPVFAKNPQAGVEEMLDSLIMRYVPSLEGVVIAHSNLTFTTPTARIKDDCPFLVCNIRFDATVWNPKIGSKMKGRIILSSPDHISLLVHRTFNVSIPRHHIPSDEWEFEYGPAENDPEFGADAADEEGQAEGETEGVKEGEEQPVKTEEASTGKWVHRTTGERLGGTDKKVEFTVIGCASNQFVRGGGVFTISSSAG